MSDALYTGKTLGGRYAVGALLGKGGFGAVYEGLQTDLGRKVAIKVLHGDRVMVGDGLARFVREARAAAALGHPNIAQVSDFQAVPGEPPFIVMEHLTGMTLGELLRQNGRLPLPRVCAIAHQILSALDATHRAGIVHRDVKPDNVFLVHMPGVEDFVKLLDFGIAKLSVDTTAPLTAIGAMLGTPSFMAPEQVTNGTVVDHRADIYAVGATMYRALAGKNPIEAENLSALLYAIVQQRPVPLSVLDPQIDPALSAIVDRAMHKDPAGRFASAGEMRAVLEPWVLGARPGLVQTPATIRAGTPEAMNTVPASTHEPTIQPVATPGSAPTSSLGLVAVTLGAAVVLVVLGAAATAAYFVLHGKDGNPSASPSAPALSAPAPTSSTSSTSTAGAVATTSAVTTAPATTRASASPAPLPPPKADAGVTGSDAGGPKERMTGTNPRITGGSWAPFGITAGRAVVETVMPAIRACHVATELDPPNHETSDWAIAIDPAGAVTNVRRLWPRPEERHPKFEGCMSAALRQTKWPTTPKGTEVKVFFRGQ